MGERTTAVSSPHHILERLNSPWVAASLVAVIYLAFILLRLVSFQFDLSAFVLAGDRFSDSRQVPIDLAVLPDSSGYDGQFYYRLALDPLTAQLSNFGITLDFPDYRQQRILYPLLIRILSQGQPNSIPFLMIVINWVALCCIGWVGGAYARALGWHASWGLALTLYPGFALSLARDLTEILAVSLLLASLYTLYRQRQMMAALLLTAAVLTKETMLIVAGGACYAYFIGQWRRGNAIRVKPVYFVLPMLVFGGWQIFLWVRWGQIPILSGEHKIDLPLLGLEQFLMRTLTDTIHLSSALLSEIYFLFLLVVLPGYALHLTCAPLYQKASWVLYALLAALYTRVIWVEGIAYWRALCELFLLGALILLGASQRRLLWLYSGGSIVVWLFYIYFLLRFR